MDAKAGGRPLAFLVRFAGLYPAAGEGSRRQAPPTSSRFYTAGRDPPRPLARARRRLPAARANFLVAPTPGAGAPGFGTGQPRRDLVSPTSGPGAPTGGTAGPATATGWPRRNLVGRARKGCGRTRGTSGPRSGGTWPRRGPSRVSRLFRLGTRAPTEPLRGPEHPARSRIRRGRAPKQRGSDRCQAPIPSLSQRAWSRHPRRLKQAASGF